MSNEPQTSEPSLREPESSEQPSPNAAPPQTAFAADAELVLTALGRMEAAIRGERATFERLRMALGETAGAIAAAKHAMQAHAIKPEPSPEGKAMAMLLDELEHRIDAMIEIAGGPLVAAAPAAEPAAPAAGEAAAPQPGAGERVPTVSGVVSRLGRGAADGSAEPGGDATPGGGEGVPTVSMLEAMVEALRAGVPAASPEPAGPQPADSPTDAGPVMPVVPAMRESELLASFAELAAFPIPPPETGAAVIFSLRTEAPSAPEATMADLAATAPEGAAATEPAAEELFEEVAPDHELVAFLFGPEGEAAAAASEAAARAAPSSGPADDPPVAADDRPAPEHPPAPEDPIASEKAQTQAPSQPPPSRAGLPAVDLMSEAPATASAALPETSAPPAQDMPAAAAEAPPKELPAAEAIAAEAPSPEPEASPPETSAPDHPLPATGDEPAAPRARDNAGQTRDPLAPLKAMSEEERIALFS